MASNITFNGVTYSVPAEGDFNWGPDLTAYFIAIASGALQKTGGTFTLTSEVNFGATYGIKSAYVKSQGTNPSGVGVLRLANTEAISWRNAANNANLSMIADASDNLLFNSKTVLFSGLGLIVNADVNASAAIAYSKLAALTTSRALQTNSSTGFVEVSSVTNTELGYVSGVTSAIQTQINAKAPSNSPTFTGTVTLPATVTGASAQVLTLPTTTTELMGLAGTQTVTGTKTFTGTTNIRDNALIIQDNADPTKQVAFELSNITTGTTRTLFFPNNGGTTLVDTGTAQTMTSKTLTSPVLQTPSVTTGAMDLQIGQIAFPSTQNPSANANTIDDYEEGTWTPVISGTGTAGAGTYTVQVGQYVKIGRMVYISAYVVISAHTGTGNITWSGLPFTSLGTANFYSTVSIGYVNTLTTAANTIPTIYINPSATTFEMATLTVAGGAVGVIAMDTAFGIMFSGCYQAAN